MDIFIASKDGATSTQLRRLIAGDWKRKMSTHGNLAT